MTPALKADDAHRSNQSSRPVAIGPGRSSALARPHPAASGRLRHARLRATYLLVASAVLTSAAAAAPGDARASKQADEAIMGAYLRLDFEGAAAGLKRAMETCAKRRCSKSLEAQLRRDLALVYVTGLNRRDEGKALLLEALELNPRLALDRDLATPEFVAAFAEAKQERRERRRRGRSGDETEEPLDEDTAPEARAAAPDRSGQAAEPGEEVETKEPAPSGSRRRKRRSASVDCPPDFPGCEPSEPDQDSEEGTDDEGHTQHWFYAGLQQDFLVFGSATGVCTPDRPSVLSCFRANDEYRSPDSPYQGTGGEINGGIAPATTRLLLSYRRNLLPKLDAGVSLGYAFGGGPAEPGGASFLPFHAELQGDYQLTDSTVSPLKLLPFAGVSLGLAQIDTSLLTDVVDQDPGSGRLQRSTVEVWRKTGTAFFGAHLGVLRALDERSNIRAELKLVGLLPSSGLSVSLAASYGRTFW